MELTKKDGEMLAEGIIKYSKVDDEGNIILDSGIQSQKIGKIREALEVFNKAIQVENFGKIQPVFYDRSGMFWMWDDEDISWKLVDETDILNMVDQLNNRNIISSRERIEIINSLKQYGRKHIPKPVKKTWIQFKNKIYDIKSGESFEATPKYFVTNPIPYEVSGDSRTPTIDKIFEEWVGKDNVKTLHEILAYSLLPDYPINRLFCFIGGGMNGKSCFLNLMKKFVGVNNVCSTELDTLINSRFEVTRLHKKLICLMGETNFNEMSKTSIIKKLTGQDTIGFEYKNKTPFEDTNYAKIIIATNNLPTTTDKTIGFYRRWLIIDFPNQFTEAKDILADIPEEEYNNLATNSVILLNELLEKREFTNEGSVEDRMKRYEEKSNPFDKFWNDNIKEDYGSFVTKAQFRKHLNEWCKEHNFRELSDQSINKKMKESGISLDSRDYMDWFEGENKSKKLVRVWKGIKLKGNYD